MGLSHYSVLPVKVLFLRSATTLAAADDDAIVGCRTNICFARDSVRARAETVRYRV